MTAPQLLSIAVALIGSIMGLNFWFIKRMVDQQDRYNLEMKDSVSDIKNETLDFKLTGMRFSKDTENRLERLDHKAERWSKNIQGLIGQAEELSKTLFKIETRVNVLIEKMVDLDQKSRLNEERLSLFSQSLTQLVGPMDIIKHEVGKHSKVVGDIETEMKTLKTAIGKVILLIKK